MLAGMVRIFLLGACYILCAVIGSLAYWLLWMVIYKHFLFSISQTKQDVLVLQKELFLSGKKDLT